MTTVYEQINENYDEMRNTGNFKQMDQTKLSANEHIKLLQQNLENQKLVNLDFSKEQYIFRAELNDNNTQLQNDLDEQSALFTFEFERLAMDMKKQIEIDQEQSKQLVEQVQQLQHEKNQIDSQYKISDFKIQEIENTMGFC